MDFFVYRHRHAAAVVGSKIYVFGGLDNDTVFSSMYVLDTIKLEWTEITCSEDSPAALHSHSMVATDSKLFIFGGCGGDKVFGDLYSFCVRTHIWQKQHIAGKGPQARFSHSMFVYKNFICVIGGCPVNKTCKEMSFVDLTLRTWRHISLTSAGTDLLVRSTANVVGDELVVIGGGAACYAFGTKFSEPISINLKPILSVSSTISGNGNALDFEVEKPSEVKSSVNLSDRFSKVSLQKFDDGVSYSFVQLEKDSAKHGKDFLKRNNWLDLNRKAYSLEDGKHICFPVTVNFLSVFYAQASTDALSVIKNLGAKVILNNAGELRKSSCSPLKVMREAIASLLKVKDLPDDLLEQLPTRFVVFFCTLFDLFALCVGVIPLLI